MDNNRKQNPTNWLTKQQKEDQRETATIEREKVEQTPERTEEQSQESSNRK